MMQCCVVFYCIVLYCIVLYCIVLYYVVLYCIVLFCIVLYCIVLVLYCIVLVLHSLHSEKENNNEKQYLISDESVQRYITDIGVLRLVKLTKNIQK